MFDRVWRTERISGVVRKKKEEKSGRGNSGTGAASVGLSREAVIARVAIGLAAATLCSVLFARIVTDLGDNSALIRTDLRISNLVQTFRTPGFTRVMVFATDLGRWQGILAGAIAVALALALQRRKTEIAALALMLGFGQGAVWLAKTLIHRSRPEPGNALTFESSFSFPSGHTFIATVFYGLAGYVLFRTARRRVRVLAALASLAVVMLIGFSRVYLGVHWPSDVLGSLAAGAVWLALTVTSLSLREPRSFAEEPRAARRARDWQDLLIAAAWAVTVGILYSSIPLRQPHTTALVTPIVSEHDVPAQLFLALPKTSEDISGRPMEPINLVFIGTEDEVRAAFVRAGWISADPLGWRALRREVVAMTRRSPYAAQPGTPTFWNGRPNRLTFEKPTAANSIRERHHIHLWNSGLDSDAGRHIWVATAHFDKGFERTSMPVPVHAIDPDIDQQREYVRKSLTSAGAVRAEARLTVTGAQKGRNFAGDHFFTDGTACLLVLR